MLKHVIFGLGLGFLAGCANLGGAPITTAPVDMTFSGAAQRTISKMDLVTVRTFKFRQGEVVGATCTLDGSGFSASFMTPAVVRLPLYAGRTDDVLVRCTDNAAAGQATLEATNLSAPDGEGLTISTGTRGTRIGAVFSIRDRAKDRFNYQNYLRVNLR